MIRKISVFAILSLVIITTCFGQQQPLKLWYDKPAQVWEETLPLGNGRLGMMPDGGVSAENIVLNDITLWSGAPQDANNYEANKFLPQIRQLLLEGKNDEAQDVINQHFVCTGKGGGSVPFGCYQVLGNLSVKYKYNSADSTGSNFKNYERELSLNRAIAKSTFSINGVTYTREYFTSFNNDINIIRLTADKPGQLNCSIGISRPERGNVAINNGELQLSGQLDNGIDGRGMQYMARVKAELQGGKMSLANNMLTIKNATEAIIYISAGTDFKGAAFKKNTEAILGAAIKPHMRLKNKSISVITKSCLTG